MEKKKPGHEPSPSFHRSKRPFSAASAFEGGSTSCQVVPSRTPIAGPQVGGLSYSRGGRQVRGRVGGYYGFPVPAIHSCKGWFLSFLCGVCTTGEGGGRRRDGFLAGRAVGREVLGATRLRGGGSFNMSYQTSSTRRGDEEVRQ